MVAPCGFGRGVKVETSMGVWVGELLLVMREGGESDGGATLTAGESEWGECPL